MNNETKATYMKKYNERNRERIRRNQKKYDARRRRDPERAQYMKQYMKQ